MKVNEYIIKDYFTEYNQRYFGGILPCPEFKIRKSYFTLGYFSCFYDHNYNMYNCVLEISDRYDYTESQLRDVIVHEMIHYYLAYTGKDIKITHKKAFKNKAKELNEKYGLHVTPIVNTEKFKKNPSFTLSYLWALLFC